MVLAAWPFGRKAWRERGLRYGPLTQRFAASLSLLRRSLGAYDVAATGSSTVEDVLGLIGEHLGLQCDPALADRAGAVLFGGRPARPEDLQHAEEFRRHVEAALRKRYGWAKSVLTWYGMPPSRRAGRGATGAGGRSAAPARNPARALRGTAG